MGNENGVAVFWSYAHGDDELDGGRVLALADHLRNEYALLTGQDLQLFVDRDDLAWGHEWRERIDRALVQSSFFLPVITPRYFTRPECRRELLDFHAQAQSRELKELLLPILYVQIDDFNEDNPDEPVRVAARAQYVDWTALRLADVDSREYRVALNGLAKRLRELVRTVEQIQLTREVSPSSASSGPDLYELLQRAEQLWPAWLDAVRADEVRDAQQQALIDTYAERRARLSRAGRKASEIAATYQQEGLAERPLSEAHLRHAEIYAAKTVELDPIMEALIRAGRQNPQMAGMLVELRDRVDEAVRIIEMDKARTGVNVHEFIKRMPFVTQVWKDIARMHDRYVALADEANATVMSWASRLDEVLALEGAMHGP